jgi:hypothetical protein
MNYAARSAALTFALLILDPPTDFNRGFLNSSLKRRVMPSTTNKRPRRNRKAANDRSKNEKKKRLGNINQIAMQLRYRSGEGIELRHYQSKGKEGKMFIVKVAWDAHHQQFRLQDPKLAHMFEDGDLYLLVVNFSPQDWAEDGQFIDLDQAEIGHA